MPGPVDPSLVSVARREMEPVAANTLGNSGSRRSEQRSHGEQIYRVAALTSEELYKNNSFGLSEVQLVGGLGLLRRLHHGHHVGGVARSLL